MVSYIARAADVVGEGGRSGMRQSGTHTALVMWLELSGISFFFFQRIAVKRILVVAEKNKQPETSARDALIFPRIIGLPKRLWTVKIYYNIRNIYVFQESLQL